MIFENMIQRFYWIQGIRLMCTRSTRLGRHDIVSRWCQDDLGLPENSIREDHRAHTTKI
jgi:hypothetical protein